MSDYAAGCLAGVIGLVLLSIAHLLGRLLARFELARESHEASQIAIHRMLVKIYEAQPPVPSRFRGGTLPPDVPRVDETAFRRP